MKTFASMTIMSVCLSVCQAGQMYIYFLFKFMLHVRFPYVSSYSVSILLLSTAASFFLNHQFESLVGVITFARVSCWRMFVMKPVQRKFGKSLAAINISLSILGVTRPFSEVMLEPRPGSSSSPPR